MTIQQGNKDLIPRWIEFSNAGLAGNFDSTSQTTMWAMSVSP
jgi:hypothetical protein